MNEIVIKGLAVEMHIGVPDEERRHPQRLSIDVILTPLTAFADLDDNLARTVDYDAASRCIILFCQVRPRHLIETLAFEIAQMLVDDFPATRAVVEVRKFILPHTDHVAVRCTCDRRVS